MLRFVIGNYWDHLNDARVIVNTVNCFGVMGAGIALEFSKRYPHMFSLYKQQCNEKRLAPGDVMKYINNHRPMDPMILNVATKYHWKNPSQYDWIERCLMNLRSVLSSDPKTRGKVLLPALGCANGGLCFPSVAQCIRYRLARMPEHEIIIFNPPGGQSIANYA